MTDKSNQSKSPLEILLSQAFFAPVEVAAILRCTVLTVRNKIKSGEIPATKDDGRWKINRADLLAYLEGKYGPRK